MSTRAYITCLNRQDWAGLGEFVQHDARHNGRPLGLAIPVVVTYLEEGIVPRLPTAVLSMGLMIVAVLSVSSGLVLDTVTRGRREMKLLAYLSQAPFDRR